MRWKRKFLEYFCAHHFCSITTHTVIYTKMNIIAYIIVWHISTFTDDFSILPTFFIAQYTYVGLISISLPIRQYCLNSIRNKVIITIHYNDDFSMYKRM